MSSKRRRKKSDARQHSAPVDKSPDGNAFASAKKTSSSAAQSAGPTAASKLTSALHPARAPMSRRRRWLFRFAAATIVPAVFFLLFELALWACGYGFPACFLLKTDRGNAYTTNQQFGWQFFPPAIARAPEVCEIPLRKSDNTYRIFVLGSSAAMGTPQPAFGLARMLEALLCQRYPGATFEVVNAAMTAINSHVALTIARECGRYQPDLFIVYAGNNEVIGPYGPGTVFGRFSSSLSLIRAGMWLKTTRTGQLVQNLMQPGTGRGKVPAQWTGMEMFEGNRVAADNSCMTKVYNHYRDNLSGICSAARQSGAKVVLSTVAVNLKDCAPFASLHRSGLGAAEEKPWEEHYQQGIELAAQGKHQAALDAWRRAEAIDDRFADLQFRMRVSLLASGQSDPAKQHFLLARDLDALRFRADTHINDVVRDLAAEQAGQEVFLVDAERVFAENERTPQGIPGSEWFYEHVHFRPEGNYLLATAVLRQIAEILPASIRSQASGRPLPATFDECCARLALSGRDRFQMLEDMAAMTDRPPFTEQLDHAQRLSATRTELNRLRLGDTSASALEQADKVYQSALNQSPDDLEIHQNYAHLLKQRGQFDRAIQQWQWLLERFPNMAKWHVELGVVLQESGQLDQAIAEFQQAMKLSPVVAPTVHQNIGTVRLKQNLPAEAEKEFRQAVALNPRMATAHNSLGVAIQQQGRTQDAVDCFRKAIEVNPSLGTAHSNLGTLLAAQNDLAGAREQFRLATTANPGDANAWNRLVGALLKSGQPDEAIHECRLAAAAMPGGAEIHFALGSLLDRAGKVNEAADEYKKAVDIDAAHLMAGHNLGASLEKLGRPSEALQQYRRVLQYHPDSVPTRNAVERLGGKQ
jgi:tetratricopeptide (TPR) repeat protein